MVQVLFWFCIWCSDVDFNFQHSILFVSRKIVNSTFSVFHEHRSIVTSWPSDVDLRVRQWLIADRVPPASRPPRVLLLPPWCQRMPLHYRVRDNVYGSATRRPSSHKHVALNQTGRHTNYLPFQYFYTSPLVHFTYLLPSSPSPVEHFLPSRTNPIQQKPSKMVSIFVFRSLFYLSAAARLFIAVDRRENAEIAIDDKTNIITFSTLLIFGNCDGDKVRLG